MTDYKFADELFDGLVERSKITRSIGAASETTESEMDFVSVRLSELYDGALKALREQLNSPNADTALGNVLSQVKVEQQFLYEFMKSWVGQGEKVGTGNPSD